MVKQQLGLSAIFASQTPSFPPNLATQLSGGAFPDLDIVISWIFFVTRRYLIDDVLVIPTYQSAGCDIYHSLICNML